MMQTRIRTWMVPLVVIGVMLVFHSAPAARAADDDPAALSWTGKLVDADCKAGEPAGACDVSTNTKSFGLVTARGAFHKLDQKGNDLAKAQLQSSKKEGSVQVTVKGRMAGETIQVEAIAIS